MLSLDVRLPGNTYPIVIGKNAVEKSLPQLKKLCPNSRAAIITDEIVWTIYGIKLQALLRQAEIRPTVIIMPPGEGIKSIEGISYVYGRLCDSGLQRTDPIIAFGGGVVGDLAGFAASTYMRGVPFVQIPTTLLAQVDSSVGGKVAINLPQGKNLVGSFYQPSLVIADTAMLQSLPKREVVAGMAEVTKYAAIGVSELTPILSKKDSIWSDTDRIVYLCCAGKADFVEKDERDTSIRMILNFGHSFGHAIEKRTNFKTYIHGEAVAMGMTMALRAGIRMGLTAPDTEQALLELMENAGLPIEYPGKISDLIPLMSRDKKNTGDKLTLILLKEMEQPFTHNISSAELDLVFKGVQ